MLMLRLLLVLSLLLFLLLPAFLTQSLQELLLPQVLIRQVNFWCNLPALLLLLLGIASNSKARWACFC